MKFSTKVQYGLKAMLHLANRYGESAVPISYIAKEEIISPAYLEQILNKLKKENLVKSVRGPRGGYVLAQRPGEISIGSIFSALDHFTGAPISSKTKGTSRLAQRASQLFWGRVEDAFQKTFDGVSLLDLIQWASLEETSKTKQSLAFNI